MPGHLMTMYQRILVCVVLSLWLGACNQVTLPPARTTYPIPLIKPLPVTVGIVYHDSILNYLHEEKSPLGKSWAIDLGSSQKTFFDPTVAAIFAKVHRFDKVEDGVKEQGLSGILMPVLADFQYATPAQTHRNLFEVWLNYEIRLLAANGEALTQWKMVAYGKVPTANIMPPQKQLTVALNRALRDAMATFATEFPDSSAVKEWLAQSTPSVP